MQLLENQSIASDGLAADADPPPGAVRTQLERLLVSAHFSRSKRLSMFLRFIVEEALSGKGCDLKEYTIGTEVYERSDSFDPVTDTIVRVEARRLRTTIQKYYADEGRIDPILIEVPKGGYEPAFRWRLDSPEKPQSAVRSCSIAVLPFEDFSPDRDQRHFCEGMAEELINTLARREGLRVVARTSAFSFHGHNTDIRMIGRALQADAVVEGSVRKVGNKLRIAAQLVGAANGYQLWSRQYDRELGDIFEIQESIARSVAAAVHPSLDGMERTPAVRDQSTDPRAYELFVKGRSHWYRQSPEGIAQAIQYLESAVEADPSYAPAHAGLAEAHLSKAKLGLSPADRNLDEAKKASETAIELDYTLPQAHVAVANVLVARDWNLAAAKTHYEEVIRTDASCYQARSHYAVGCLLPSNRTGEAVGLAKEALDLDPLSAQANLCLAWCLYAAGRNGEAAQQCEKTLGKDGSSTAARWLLSLALEKMSRYDVALRVLEEARRAAPHLAMSGIGLARIYGLLGERDRARDLLAEVSSARSYVPPYWMAIGYSTVDHAEAIAWLEKAYERRDVFLLPVLYDPSLENLREDDSFNQFVRKVKSGVVGV